MSISRRNTPFDSSGTSNASQNPDSGEKMNSQDKDHCCCCGSEHHHHHEHACSHNHHDRQTGCACCSGSLPLVPDGLDGTQRIVYRIANMDCHEEEALIRQKLGSLTGIVGLDFNLIRQTLTVHHNLATTAGIETALSSIDMDWQTEACPDCIPGKDNLATENVPGAPEKNASIALKKLIFSGILAALAEAVDLFGHSAGETWHAGSMALPDVLTLCLAVAAIILSGLDTYKKGWLAVRNANLNMNALMSVAVTGAMFLGQFPEAAMVMVLFNVSEAIEAKSLERVRKAIGNLLDLTPETAAVQQADGTWLETDIRRIAIGSHVRVRPGEKIGLDGVLIEGTSTVNQAPITGESLPISRTVGDPVYAGTLNESGSFVFSVTAAAGQTTLARIIQAVEDAQANRAPIQRFVDSFAKYYTPCVFALAVLAALVPPLAWDRPWFESIYTALAILVIGCPCSLVLSTPITIVGGLAAATRQGILIKGGIFLELGKKLKWLALDKTGTLTHGQPHQTDFACTGNVNAETVQTLSASLAARSDHPVSGALAEYARETEIPLQKVENFTALPGRGVCGDIAGHRWYLGSIRLAAELRHDTAHLDKKVAELEQEGKTTVMLMDEHGVHGLFAVADTVRASSRQAIEELQQLGIRTVMLTGDNEHTAAAIARQAGLTDFHAGLLPEDKLQLIEKMERGGNTVGMVGDGINDAPALARANIGFAMAASGSDTAIETADVALMDDDLRKIPRFVRLSRGIGAILRQNIAITLGIKATFFALAFSGNATMWMAVFADVGTTLIAVANGLRAMRIRA